MKKNIKKTEKRLKPEIVWNTLQETNISTKNGILKMIFLFPKVGYVNVLEGSSFQEKANGFLMNISGQPP